MQIAKLFKNGQSQAVRLPKEFRFDGESVYIHHVGNSVVLVPKDNPWSAMLEARAQFSDDFMAERDQGIEVAEVETIMYGRPPSTCWRRMTWIG